MSTHLLNAVSWSQSFCNLILPARCMGCGKIIRDHHSLCSECWNKCHFLTPPWCSLCGWPFPYESVGVNLCPHCHRLPPLFTHCRSALVYDENSRNLILKLKQGDATYLAPGLAKFLLSAGRDILSQTDLLVPIPLHWKRLFLRQYNQAVLLSYQLTQLSRIPTHTGLIKRHRSTSKQGHQTPSARLANVKNAFIVTPEHNHFIVGKCVTLVDDVFTTGATVNECAHVLLRAGAKEVRVLTLARVISSL